MLAIIALSVLHAGCSGIPIHASDGTTHYVIVGIGIVSVDNSKTNAAVVTRADSVGLSISGQPGMKVGIGYASGCTVQVAEGAEDVRMEVSRRPGGPIVVEVDSARLKPVASSHGGRSGTELHGSE
jgi:hypothetical protein